MSNIVSNEVKDKNISVSYEMLKIDFQMKYNLMIEASKSRNSAARFCMSFITSPFIFFTALLSTKVIKPENLNTFYQIPQFFFFIVLLIAIFSVVPFFQFIEANSRYIRTIRIINNFRNFYEENINQLTVSNWSSGLPTDKTKPVSFSFSTWAGIHIVTFSIINSVYISFSIVMLADNNDINWLAFSAFFVISMLGHITLYGIKK